MASGDMSEQPAAVGDADADDEELSDDETESASSSNGDSSSCSASDTDSAAPLSATKKKKKKKNKKKGAKADGSEQSTPPLPNKAEKADAEKRFMAACKVARDNDEMWVDCSGSLLQDAKARKLLEVLKTNTTATSLDLSANSLTDEGAQAISAALASNSSVPGLITLDLRDNSFTQIGLNALEGLTKMRKDLAVLTGSKKEEVAQAAKETSSSKGMKDLSDNRLVRKYFDICQDEEPEDISSPQQAMPAEPSISPEELWFKLETSVAEGQQGISGQLPLLQQLSSLLQIEIVHLNEGHDPLGRPHIKACLEHLHTLDTILSLTPRPVIVQFSRHPQPAVGSHRVWAADALAHLVSLNCEVIDHQVAASKLLPRVVHLALGHARCSAVHARALRLIRAALTSPCPDLLGPVLVAPGWGAHLKQPALPGHQDGEAGQGEADTNGSTPFCEPLPELIARQAALSLGVDGGRRNALMGFLIETARALAGCEPDSDDLELMEAQGSGMPAESGTEAMAQRVLRASNAWSDFMDPESGAFAKLTKEQEGDLGGPRAVRGPPDLVDTEQELADLAGGGLITGQEILALLQGMSLS